ncbi:MAG: hypothetical protein NW206_05065 [Hyphomonadaceae bacterium]|nr:hypothetical protein [Hyphomonadaceae bacterium]
MADNFLTRLLGRNRPPSEWVAQIFTAQQVLKGGIVRRQVADVHKYASLDLLVEEVKRREFHMVQTGNQYVILCHPGEFKVIC